jgi:hypothetical protein
MRFAAVIRQKHAPAPSPQADSRPVPDELSGDAQTIAPQAQDVPADLDLDQLVRLAGEW